MRPGDATQEEEFRLAHPIDVPWLRRVVRKEHSNKGKHAEEEREHEPRCAHGGTADQQHHG
jgi:hypothetical protein